MTDIDYFSITERQYNIIIKQVKDNYPYEAGGFIGGKDQTITAILPVFNQDISNKTNIFAISREDMDRAHLFFDKHGCEYYGTYHSHPKTDPTPSEQDLSHIQKYLFIIGLINFDAPDFAVYKITGHKSYKRLDLKILPDSKFDVKNINGNNSKKKDTPPDYNDTDQLNIKVHNVFDEKPLYEKEKPSSDDSDFSTLA